MLGGFAVSGVEISNAQVRWDDSSTGQQIALQKVNLTTGQLVPGEPVDVKLDFAVDSKAPELTGDVALNGTVQVSESMQQIRVTPVEICLRDARLPDDTVAVGCLNGGLQADLASRQFLLNGMVLDLEARGGALPPDGLSAELKGDVAADLAKQTLRFTGFQLQSGGLRLTGEINAKSLLGEPSFAGRFTLNEFSPRDLLETMALPAPETADPAVLSRLAAEFEVAGDTNQVTLKPVVVALDDTQIDGDIAVRDFANPLVSFALRVDSIDVDRYLPPPTETAKTAGATSDTPVESAPKNAALFPVAVLRTLNVDGRFTVDALKVSGLKAEKVQLELKASDGKIQLDQTVGSFYEGGYNGRLNLDASAEIPRVHTVNRLTGIQVGPLLKDLTGEDRLTGRGHFNADLRAQGQNPQALRASLGGGLDFRFHDGAVKGINLAKLLRETKARLKGKPVVPMTEAEQTDFSEISASFQADRGVLSNRDLQGKSPLLRVTGKGDADLVRELLDYRVEAVIVGTLKGQGGDELEQLRGVPIPVQIRGPFAKLDYTVDWSKVVEDRAKAKAQEQIDKHKDKLLDKLFNR
jgi:AsmA protein